MWSVYMFTNALNGKKYIGISSNIVSRINNHRRMNNSAPAFHNAIKYNVSPTTILDIRNNKTWKHMKRPNIKPKYDSGLFSIPQEIRDAIINDSCSYSDAVRKYKVCKSAIRKIRRGTHIKYEDGRRNIHSLLIKKIMKSSAKERTKLIKDKKISKTHLYRILRENLQRG